MTLSVCTIRGLAVTASGFVLDLMIIFSSSSSSIILTGFELLTFVPDISFQLSEWLRFSFESFLSEFSFSMMSVSSAGIWLLSSTGSYSAIAAGKIPSGYQTVDSTFFGKALVLLSSLVLNLLLLSFPESSSSSFNLSERFRRSVEDALRLRV